MTIAGREIAGLTTQQATLATCEWSYTKTLRGILLILVVDDYFYASPHKKKLATLCVVPLTYVSFCTLCGRI